MEVVIDAQVMLAYYREQVLGHDPSAIGLTGSAIDVINRLAQPDRAYVDDGGQVENEWRSVIGDSEWLRAWLIEQLDRQHIVPISTNSCNVLRKRLIQDCGFPTRSRDIWYVRVAMAIVRNFDEAVLVSEDMDLHDPPNKQATHMRRLRILLSGRGTVAKLLDGERVRVRCVQLHLANAG